MAFFKYSSGEIEKVLCSCGEELVPEESCCKKCGKKVVCDLEEEDCCCGESCCSKSSCCQDSKED